MNDWRKRCEHGRYEPHWRSHERPYHDDNVCPGGSPVTTADLESLGDSFDWCVIHLALASDHTGNCEIVRALLIPITDKEVET